MLEAIGLKALTDLFVDVPKEALKDSVDIEPGLSELRAPGDGAHRQEKHGL